MATDTKNPMPPLSAHDREALKASLAQSGQQYPIIRSAGPAMQGQIVDGFTREELLKELGIEPKYVSERFETEAEFRLRQIDLNVARRQLTIPQRAMLALAREPWERQLAAQRSRAGKPLAESGQRSGEAGRATVRAAQAVGLKRSTYEAARHVIQQAPEEIREAFLRGEMSVDKAYRQAKRATGTDAHSVLTQRVAARLSEPLPGGKFSGIVIAPPWRTQPMKFEQGRFLPNELATMDIGALAARDAILALWTTNLWLPEAWATTETWGAQPFALVTWVLDEAFATDTLRDRTRHGILAAFGKRPAQSRRSNLVTGGNGNTLPGEAFALIEDLAPGSTRLSMFAPTRRSAWKVWAPEVE